MSLLDNIANVSFYSAHPTDKIVKVWEGSFDMSSDTTTRTGSGTIYAYPIAHGFTRPLFTNLIWSVDNSTWWDGGTFSTSDSVGAIAFSDSSNAYIATTSNSGTLYYKLIGTWIDDYDATNPAIDAFTTGEDKLNFDSRANYQKIYDGDVITYSAGTFGSQTTIPIAHLLQKIPNAKAYFEPISGEVWPLNAGGSQNPFLYSLSQDEATISIDSDSIDIKVTRFSNEQRRIWYRIYYDD